MTGVWYRNVDGMVFIVGLPHVCVVTLCCILLCKPHPPTTPSRWPWRCKGWNTVQEQRLQCCESLHYHMTCIALSHDLQFCESLHYHMTCSAVSHCTITWPALHYHMTCSSVSHCTITWPAVLWVIGVCTTTWPNFIKRFLAEHAPTPPGWVWYMFCITLPPQKKFYK